MWKDNLCTLDIMKCCFPSINYIKETKIHTKNNYEINQSSLNMIFVD